MQRAERYPWADRTPKTRALLDAARSAGLSAERPPLAVAFGERPGQPFDSGADNLHGAARETCRLCGGCDVGCQYGSKQTVDFTYLSAAVAAGAQVRTCCEARALDRDGERWVVRYRQHLPARDGHPEHLLDPVAEAEREVARRSGGPRGGDVRLDRACCCAIAPCCRALSPRLGRGFSGNGDLLLFLLDADRYLDPATGPVITASVSVPDARVAQRARLPGPGRRGAGLLGVAVAGPRGARRPVARAAPASRPPRRSARRARRRPWRRCSAWAATCRAGAWSCAATGSR